MWANVLIAIGAILPGIGGTATRMGHVEVLYVTELIGLLLTWAGYRISVRPSASEGTRHKATRQSERFHFCLCLCLLPCLLPSAFCLLPSASLSRSPICHGTSRHRFRGTP